MSLHDLKEMPSHMSDAAESGNGAQDALPANGDGDGDGDDDGTDGSHAGSSFHIPTSEASSSSALTDSDLLPPIHQPIGMSSAEGQATFFKRVECWSRLLNGFLTPYEKYVLEHETNDFPQSLQNDLKKVIAHFGKPHGAGAPCKRLLKECVKANNVGVGDLLEPQCMAFTFCRHLLLADRNMEALMEDRQTIGCSCFAATYAMPQGCKHKRLGLHQQDRFLPTTLCSICSYCLRCNKFLGLEAFQGRVMSFMLPQLAN